MCSLPVLIGRGLDLVNERRSCFKKKRRMEATREAWFKDVSEEAKALSGNGETRSVHAPRAIFKQNFTKLYEVLRVRKAFTQGAQTRSHVDSLVRKRKGGGMGEAARKACRQIRKP